MKLISLRVVVPADDDVTTAELQDHLELALERRGVELLGQLAHRRVHWPAVEVLRGGERHAPPAARRARPAAAKPGAPSR